MLDNTMDTLRILADETDGRAIVNSNDLDSGLKQIVRDSSAYYLLGYTSAVTHGRQVPQDQRAREAAGRAGARAPRLSRAERGRSGARAGAEESRDRLRPSPRRWARSPSARSSGAI